MKRVTFFAALMVAAALILVACSSGPHITKPPSQLTERVFATQSVLSPTAASGVLIIDGADDTPLRGGEIGVQGSPTLMSISPDRTTLLVYASQNNSYSVGVVNTKTESLAGGISLPGPTTNLGMAVVPTGSSYTGFVAVPAAPFTTGPAPGAVEVLNLTTGAVTATISVPNAQTVVASPDGTQLLVFSGDSDAVTVMSPLLVNTGNPVTATVAGFDRPVYALFSADSTTAYVLNCGAECGGTQASVQVLNLTATPPILGANIPVNGATIGFLEGSTLYVAGNGTPTGPLCASIPSAAPTAAQYCGTLDVVNLTTLQDPNYNNPANEIAITDGYHDRIDMGNSGQLFIGSHTCTNVGNVNNVTGEVRGCLSIFNTTTGAVIIPPDNGDVTGLQGFTSRLVEYVAEGGNLRVYYTVTGTLLYNDYITTGTIVVTGQIFDVKAVDFF